MGFYLISCNIILLLPRLVWMYFWKTILHFFNALVIFFNLLVWADVTAGLLFLFLPFLSCAETESSVSGIPKATVFWPTLRTFIFGGGTSVKREEKWISVNLHTTACIKSLILTSYWHTYSQTVVLVKCPFLSHSMAQRRNQVHHRRPY